MISERHLVRRGRLWWTRWAPGLPDVWRSMSSTSSSISDGGVAAARRWLNPLEPGFPPRDADLVAETAFGLFASALELETSSAGLDRSQVALIQKRAVARIMLLRGTGRDLGDVMISEHLDFAMILADRLLDWTKMRRHPVEVQPRLAGIGAVDACYPDVILGAELVEVKMTRSMFKLDDLRQALVYCALAWLGTERRIEKVTLVNPLLGVEWSFDMKRLVRSVSGKPASVFFEEFGRMTLGENVF